MVWYEVLKVKIGSRFRHAPLMLVLLVIAFLLTQNYWWPLYDQWRCSRLAANLSDQYNLVIRYGDPAEFYVPPLPAQKNNPNKGFIIGRADRHSAHTAMIGLKQALEKYPSALIQKYLKAVFISGIIKIYNVQGGGTYLHSWIYISATPEYEPLGPAAYEKILHHELSSILFLNTAFPAHKWYEINDDSFTYLENPEEIVKQAAIGSRRDATEAPRWHQLGFVHDYGMASLENDFNTYAELAMTHPERLKALVQKYPRIRAKTKILVDFYNSLAPEMRKYFEAVGVVDNLAVK